MGKEKMPDCCNGCGIWEKHQHSCFYYWESKKDCTMHSERQ